MKSGQREMLRKEKDTKNRLKKETHEDPCYNQVSSGHGYSLPANYCVVLLQVRVLHQYVVALKNVPGGIIFLQRK